jgi:hypothetical protein
VHAQLQGGRQERYEHLHLRRRAQARGGGAEGAGGFAGRGAEVSGTAATAGAQRCATRTCGQDAAVKCTRRRHACNNGRPQGLDFDAKSELGGSGQAHKARGASGPLAHLSPRAGLERGCR